MLQLVAEDDLGCCSTSSPAASTSIASSTYAATVSASCRTSSTDRKVSRIADREFGPAIRGCPRVLEQRALKNISARKSFISCMIAMFLPSWLSGLAQLISSSRPQPSSVGRGSAISSGHFVDRAI
ncbi:MAG: hypothetical protein R2710_18805 [Acidimicrobiales bacterium]